MSPGQLSSIWPPESLSFLQPTGSKLKDALLHPQVSEPVWSLRSLGMH